MNRFLPIGIFLFIIYHLSFIIPASAQDITPSVSPAILNVNPQGNSAWDNFIGNLIPGQFKQVPGTLEKINCSKLPSEACESIKNPDSLVNPQANDDTGKNELVSNAAGQYTIGSGVHTPPEVSNASTNIFLDFVAKLADIFNIFKQGEKEAKNYAGATFPQDVTDQQFAQGVQDGSAFASGNPNVLGAQSGQAAMDIALPMVQCGALPAGLCGSDNKPNVVQPNL